MPAIASLSGSGCLTSRNRVAKGFFVTSRFVPRFRAILSSRVFDAMSPYRGMDVTQKCAILNYNQTFQDVHTYRQSIILEFAVQNKAIEPIDVSLHAETPDYFGRFSEDKLVGVGMAVVMLVAMAGWLYALGWTAWQAFRWLAN